MPLSPFDAIMPIKPTRPVEPGWRSSGADSDFRPAFSRAYEADRPTPAPARPEKRDQPPVDKNRREGAPKLGADENRRSHSPAVPDESASAQRARAESKGGDDRPDEREDAVDSAAEGATAAAAQQAAQTVEMGKAETAAEELIQGIEEAASDADAVKTQAMDEAPLENETAPSAAEAGSQGKLDESSRSEGESGSSERQNALANEVEPSAHGTAASENSGAAGQPFEGATEISEAATKEPAGGKNDQDAHGKSRATALLAEPVETANQPTPHAAAVAAIERVQTPPTDAGRQTAAATEGTAAVPADSKSSTGSSDRIASALERLSARALRNSEKSEPSDGNLQIDRARFVQRVEGAIRAAHQRDGKIQVRLSPPELGSLRIELAVQNGVMTAKVEAETPAARNVLLDSLPQLRERLAQQDIRVEKFDVDVRRDGGGASGGNPFEQPDGQSRDDRQHHRPSLLMSRISSPKSTPLGSASAVGDGALDVRI